MQSSETPLDLWEQLGQQHPQCRQLLLQIVGLAYEEERNGQLLPFEGDLNLLKPAVTTDLIQIDSGGFHFVDPTIRERATAQYLIEQSLLSTWDDIDRFTRSLQRIRESDLAATVLTEIHNKYNHDVVTRLAEDTPKEHFWSLCHLVFKSLPKLNLETRSLASALSKTQEIASGDMADHIIYRGVQALAESQPTLAISLIEEISREPSAPTTAFIPPLLRGISRSSFIHAFKHAIELSASEHLNFQRAGIVTLSTLDYSDTQLKERQQVLDLFHSLLQSDSDEVLAAIAFGYQQILHFEKETATTALIELSSRNSATIQFSISKALFAHAKEHGKEDWFLKALFNLARVDSSLNGIVRNIEFVLQHLLEANAHQAVLDFFQYWACYHEVHPRQYEDDSFKSFESLASSLVASHRPSLEKAITRWFSSDKRELHRLAARLVHIATRGTSNSNQTRFLKLAFEPGEEITRANLMTILRRILGYVFSVGGLGGLTFSALSIAPKDRELRAFVIEAFCSYIIYNFPSLLDTFITDKVRSGQPFERGAAREIQKQVRAYRQAREKLPRLKDLQVQPRAIRLARAKRKKMNETIERGIEEHSVFLQLFPKVTLKAGTSWFSEVNGHFTEKSNLGHFRQEMELPTGEIIDPVGQFRLRVAWLQEEEDSN
jgi:hypothetical protein